MKTLLILLVTATSVLADVPLTREEAATLRGYDLATLRDRALTLQGKLVRIKFNYRSQHMTKADGGGVSGTVCDSYGYLPNDRGGRVAVVVPAEGLPWFQNVTAESEGRKAYSAIGRVIVTESSTIPVVELIGREMKTDLKGARAVWK